MPMFKLVQPSLEYADEFLHLVREYQTLAIPDQFQAITFLYDPDVNHATLADLIARRQANTNAANLPAHLVPSTDFWLFADDMIVGVSSLRHYLNAKLENHGGHIGYNVRPSQRGKGYATKLLALTLNEARSMGINRILITCHRDNIASAAVIRNNGGILASEGIADDTGEPVLRFWITSEHRTLNI